MESTIKDPESDVIAVTKLSSMLECPVCFNVPRDLPIPQCPAGHVICKSCKASVTSCPTCRRRLYNDGTSSLAASMIELIPHRCKFSEHGCEVKDYLVQLKNHEEKCVERTVKCPSYTCQAEVQLKKFDEHARQETCWVNLSEAESEMKFIQIVSSGFMQWDGVSKHKGDEFDLDHSSANSWLYVGISTFIIKKYIPKSRLHLFCIMMAKNPEEVKQYKAKITIQNESFETNCECPVIPIEELPPEEELIDHEGSWIVHHSLLRKFFYFEDRGENNNHNWKVKYKWKIEIVQK